MLLCAVLCCAVLCCDACGSLAAFYDLLQPSTAFYGLLLTPIAIGDPMQLAPITKVDSVINAIEASCSSSSSSSSCDSRSSSSSGVLATSSAGKPWRDLSWTVFERLSSIGVPTQLLSTQYRCHPLLSGLASRLFYGGRLTDGVRIYKTLLLNTLIKTVYYLYRRLLEYVCDPLHALTRPCLFCFTRL